MRYYVLVYYYVLQNEPYRTEIIPDHIFNMAHFDSSVRFYGPFDVCQAEEFEKQKVEEIRIAEHKYHLTYHWDCAYCNQEQ
jgi:hypothetical protein